MNTYGKIILENGKKVYKRFGAAAKQKIKLGTAAFADIVSNPTKSDVGKVPDASFVAGQQEAIEALNSAIDLTKEQFFDATYAEVGFLNVKKRGNVVSIYGRMKANSAGNNAIKVADVNIQYVPLIGTAAFYAYDVNAPYLPVGTLWILGNAEFFFYPVDKNSDVSFYISEEYSIHE